MRYRLLYRFTATSYVLSEKFWPAVKNRAEHIYDPAEECAGEYPEDTENEYKRIAGRRAFDNSVYRPNDIERGNTKDQFYNPRQLVE